MSYAFASELKNVVNVGRCFVAISTNFPAIRNHKSDMGPQLHTGAKITVMKCKNSSKIV